MLGRRIYASSNGDVWDLVRDGGTGRVHVMHTPNLASGGTTSYSEVGQFLARGAHNAECVALIELIGTLIDDPMTGRGNDAASAQVSSLSTEVVLPTKVDKYIEAAKRDRDATLDHLPGDVEKPSE